MRSLDELKEARSFHQPFICCGYRETFQTESNFTHIKSNANASSINDLLGLGQQTAYSPMGLS